MENVAAKAKTQSEKSATAVEEHP